MHLKMPGMTMMRLIIGTALGFVVAQAGLYGVQLCLRWLQRKEAGGHDGSRSGQVIVGGFIRYAAPIGAAAALITLTVWAVGDYLAARAARNAALADGLEAPPSASVAHTQGSADEAAGPNASSTVEAATGAQPETGDPYADPDYRVHRRAHRAGTSMSLKETLLQRSEAKARAELLRDMQQHASRSQYDCEAAEHVARYLKAGLDVWGFGAWQMKYFPAEGYKGATLAGCKDIPNVVDPSQLDLQSTVAQESR